MMTGEVSVTMQASPLGGLELLTERIARQKESAELLLVNYVLVVTLNSKITHWASDRTRSAHLISARSRQMANLHGRSVK